MANKGKEPAPPTTLIRGFHLPPSEGQDAAMPRYGPQKGKRFSYNNISSQTGCRCREINRQFPCPKAVWLQSCLLHSLAFVLFARSCSLCPSRSVFVSEGRNGGWSSGVCLALFLRSPPRAYSQTKKFYDQFTNRELIPFHSGLPRGLFSSGMATKIDKWPVEVSKLCRKCR